MRRLILVATFVIASFVGLHRAPVTQSGAHTAVTAHATTVVGGASLCGGVPLPC